MATTREVVLAYAAPKTLEEFEAASGLEASIQDLIKAEVEATGAKIGSVEGKLVSAGQGLESLRKAAEDILAAVQIMDAKMAEEACLRLASAIKSIQDNLAV